MRLVDRWTVCTAGQPAQRGTVGIPHYTHTYKAHSLSEHHNH